VANAERGVAYLDQRLQKAAAVIDGDVIDWQRYLKPEDKTRIIPAELLAEKGKARAVLGPAQEEGLTLPWGKTHGKVLIKPGKLAVWTGWSRHGKTQMLKQVMLHAIRNSERVLVASMEEDVLDVWSDMARIACGMDPNPKKVDRFVEFVKGKLWLYDQEGMVEPKRIQAVIRYAAENLKITQAVIDSLMMLAVDRDDYDAQSRFVGELKTTAKDTGVTVHLVAHMRKREGKGGDESPGNLHDISGGHEIGSKADYVFVPWRDIQRKDGTAPQCVLKVEKQRGRINWLGTVGLNFHDATRQFIEDVHPMSFWDEEAVPF
jgi:twinkle protein